MASALAGPHRRAQTPAPSRSVVSLPLPFLSLQLVSSSSNSHTCVSAAIMNAGPLRLLVCTGRENLFVLDKTTRAQGDRLWVEGLSRGFQQLLAINCMPHSPQRQTVIVIHQKLLGLPEFYTVILTDEASLVHT